METLQHLILHDMPDSEEIEAVKSGAHTLTYKSYRKRINQLANACCKKEFKKATVLHCFAKTVIPHQLLCLLRLK